MAPARSINSTGRAARHHTTARQGSELRVPERTSPEVLHSHACIHTRTRTHTRRHTREQTHSHTRMHSLTHARTQTQTHTHTHTHTDTHTCTHTYTHTHKCKSTHACHSAAALKQNRATQSLVLFVGLSFLHSWFCLLCVCLRDAQDAILASPRGLTRLMDVLTHGGNEVGR
jgi:hypothetical protein